MIKNVVVFSKPNCRFCNDAKRLLDKLGTTYTVFDIEQDETAKKFLIDSGFRTVPQVYTNGQLIGGYEDLQDYIHAIKEAHDPQE